MSNKINYRQKILEKAIAMATEDGFATLTRDGVAVAAGVAAGMVNKCFGTIEGLRCAVVAEAVRTENLGIVAQGLANGYEEARQAPMSLKARAFDYLVAL